MRSRIHAARAAHRFARRPQIEGLEERRVLAMDPIITEFQAVNSSTRLDSDGDASDWIELFNPDTAPIDLSGWHLTDDPADLTQWTFPSLTLGPREFLVVSASSKDRRDPLLELHTNFRLSGDGEFLALVRPDGTVAQSFDPFPAQFENQSYGQAVGRVSTLLVDGGSAVRAFVPPDGGLGLEWTQPQFADAGWTAGQMGIGYERLRQGYVEPSDFEDGQIGPGWTVDVPAASVGSVTVAGGALVINVPAGQNMTSTDRGLAPLIKREIPADAADWELVADVAQGTLDRGSTGFAVLDAATGLPILQFEYASRLNFRVLAGTDSVASVVSLSRDSYSMRLVRDSLAGTYSAYFRLTEGDEWRLVGTARDGDDVAVADRVQLALYGRTPSSTMTARYDRADFIVPDQVPVYSPLIRTDLGAAMEGVNASAYVRIPFELSPDRVIDELTLVTQHDDGFIAYLNGVEVTAQNVPIESTWNSAAGGEFGAVNGRIPTRQYDLSNLRQLLRPGTNLLAIHAMNVAADDVDFFFSTSLIATEVVGAVNQFFAQPTPGAANSSPAAAPPVILGAQGLFFGSTQVEMQLQTPNPQLEIRYTLDGSEPSAGSALYTQPFTLTQTAMLQARVFDTSSTNPLQPSPMASATLIAVAETLRERTSDIPLVLLDTLGQGLPASGATSLASVNVVAIEVSDATGRASFDNPLVDYLGRGGIRDRGSSTAGQPKPNLSFETWGGQGTTEDDDEDVGLLGFAPDSDWVLHAPYTFDRALIRNQLAFALTNSLGHWAPGTRAVEVYLNRGDGVVSESDYAGVYVLMDKISLGPDRVDITPVTPEDNAEPDISGGYIWKIDRADPGEPSFTAGGVSMNWVEPKSPGSVRADEDQRATREQQNWVIDYFNKFRDASRNGDINDPEGYSKYIDVDSWIDNHLMYVLGDNVDALNLSTYLHKDRGKKIEFGPQWDYDRSMESDDSRDDNPNLWGGSGGTAFFTSNFWAPLFQDPGFWQRYVDRWTEWRRNELSDAALNRWIDKLADEVRESQERNMTKWTASRGRRSSPYNSGKLDGTWEGEVEHLRTWILERAAFMDRNFVAIPTASLGVTLLSVGGTSIPPDSAITLAGPMVTYFEDTDLISAEVGGATARYFIPSDDTLGTSWADPAFNDTQWAQGQIGIGFDSGSNFGEFIRTEVQMPEGGTTILARIPFMVDDVNAIDDLVLRMRYDDGYVAYLNGVEVVRRNLRDDILAWNSRANSHANADGQRFEDQSINEFRHLLVPGQNVLAIRGINASFTSTDMLIQPALVSRQTKFGLNPVGDVYYTTDGSDPRGPDGNPSPTAILSQRGQPIPVPGTLRIIARNFDNITDRGLESRIVRTSWSAPAEYTLVVDTPELVLSEINYHPSPVTPEETAAGWTEDDFEFIEVRNAGDTSADLTGVQLREGVDFDFFHGNVRQVAPGGYVLVVANKPAFEHRYGAGLPVAGEFAGQLANGGERITLVDGLGNELISVDYGDNDLWGQAADGFGSSLSLRDPQSAPGAAAGKWYSWTARGEFGGSPGRTASPLPTIAVNEVIARGATQDARDALELFNYGTQSIDVGGWYLSDSANNFLKYRIPAGTQIAAGQRLVIDDRQFNADPPSAGNSPFGLNGLEGDSVWLVIGDGRGGVLRFVDEFHFTTQHPGESYGRLPDGSGLVAPFAAPTLGAANGEARRDSLVISEVHYAPTPSAAAGGVYPNLEPSHLEFVEIWNPSAAPIELTGWQLRGGVTFEFPAGQTLAANGRMVVLSFDPLDPENARRVQAFRVQYGLADDLPLQGGFGGRLNDDGDRVTLLRPDVIDRQYHVPVDQVVYDNLAPWPEPAVQGASLVRVDAGLWGTHASAWTAATPSPGAAGSLPSGDFDGDGALTANDIDLLFVQIRSPQPAPGFDLNGDGRVDQGDRDLLVISIAGTTFGDTNLDGRFDSADLVRISQAGQYEDNVRGNSGWATGDWDGDGDFTTRDLVLAFQRGGYEETGIVAASRSELESFEEPGDDDWLLELATALASGTDRNRPEMFNS